MLLCSATAFPVYAESKYTDVLADLQSDPSFDASAYPVNAANHALDVIQVAESDARELFVYVYRPYADTKDLPATTIRISQSPQSAPTPKDYPLERLSTVGTLEKYLVKDFTLKPDALRYYDVICIFRAWDSDYDSASGNDNTVSEVACEVAKFFTASTVDGKVSYTCVGSEVITVTDKYCGFVRYNNGFNLYVDKCDAWYVAFSTDRDIDYLYDADVAWIEQSRSWSFVPGSGESEKLGEPEPKDMTLSDKDTAENPADGLFGKKYKWKRIESVKTFIANEQLDDETKTALEGKQWVLRFVETPYTLSSLGMGATRETSTIVSDVTILRLHFRTGLKTYNLGVVDNKQSGDWQNPDNTNQNEINVNPFSKDASKATKIFWTIVGIILGAIALLILAQTGLLPAVGKALVWLVCLPFKAIAALIGAIANAAKRGKAKRAAKKDSGHA